MLIKIVRVEHQVALPGQEGHTRSVILIDGVLFACGMEKEDLFNQQDISCIPNGVYKARKYTSKAKGTTGGKTLVIENVPNRTGILFHIGNYPEDSLGCILLGDSFSVEGRKMILNSGSAVARFREAIAAATHFTVEIVSV